MEADLEFWGKEIWNHACTKENDIFMPRVDVSGNIRKNKGKVKVSEVVTEKNAMQRVILAGFVGTAGFPVAWQVLKTPLFKSVYLQLQKYISTLQFAR
jgi:hypothetical protein